MKSLNLLDLREFVQSIKPRLLESPLQDVWTDGEVLALEFYSKEGSLWLCVDLQPEHPKLGIFLQKPKLKKNPKPIVLFLKAHAVPMRLLDLDFPTEDRVLCLNFGSEHRTAQILMVLIPKFTNLLVSARSPRPKQKMGKDLRFDEKNIAWSRPRDLPEAHALDLKPTQKWDWSTALEYSKNWWAKTHADGDRPPPLGSQPAPGLQNKDLQKKQGALAKIEAALPTEELIQKWIAFGEWLKWNEQPSIEFQALWDLKKTNSENRDHAFAMAKNLKRKRLGGVDRLEQLKKEIQKLERQAASGGAVLPKTRSQATQVLQKAEAGARTLRLASGLEAVMGKSAKDNLQILRKARGWDLWLHLRDFPSAHAVVFRNKEQKVSDLDLEAVAGWLATQSLSKKMLVVGQDFYALMTECRFVRPVKGQPGLVNYQNERVFKFRVKSEP
jgi:predicted ribosome quality control (RQC) complex YloA/Tae2 family protein